MGMSSPCVNCGADLRVCKDCDWYNGKWMSEADYENRLKADIVAMLTELQLEIEEMEMKSLTEKEIWNNAIGVCSDLIQQKINSLKEDLND